MTAEHMDACMFCGSTTYRLVHQYTKPPVLETTFASASGEAYHRNLFSCTGCGHFYSHHDMALSDLYGGEYADSNYPGDKLRQTFERIISLPTDRSDNAARVLRIRAYAESRLTSAGLEHSVIDIGSGLAVFPWGMKAAGWDVSALDPDPRQAQHARDVVGIECLEGDFMQVAPTKTYAVVTFNKVLEHVDDPIGMLARTKEFLSPGGLCYVELPDAEAAIHDEMGPEREEFLIDHPHVFSAASMALLAMKAGFRVDELRRIREPSTKYTMYMFLSGMA